MKLPSIATLSIEEQQACKRVVCFKAPDGNVYVGAGVASPELGMPRKQLVSLPKSPEDCWLWVGAFTSENVPTKTHNGRSMLGHRWLWAQLFGPIDPGYNLGHTCGNEQCVNPHHLAVMTQAECVRAGEKTVLVKGDIQAIRGALRNGASQATLARMYGVTQPTISVIKSRKSWKTPKLSKRAGVVVYD